VVFAFEALSYRERPAGGLLMRVMGHDWKCTAYRVHVVNLPHAPTATHVKKSHKTQSEHCGKEECQKRPKENHNGDYANQKL